MKRRTIIIPTLLIGLGVGGLTVSQALAQNNSNVTNATTTPNIVSTSTSTAPWSNNGYAGMMGSGFAPSGDSLGSGNPSQSGWYGMMGSGAQGTNRSLVNNVQLIQLVRQGETGAIIDRKTNTVTYKNQSVTLVALASPHGKPNMTWEIDGLVNPTVVVSSKAQVRLTLVNTDWGYMHGFEVTASLPPYPFMSMMAVNNDFLLMPLPQRTTKSLTSAQYDSTSGLLNLRPGTYYYLCPVPGHAQQGMYGEIIVS